MTSADNRALIDKLYTAFANKDGEAMAACYRDDATFSDPVFVGLDAAHVRGMWRMFCARSTDLVVRHSDVVADEGTGSARWEADYTFSATGRFVKNRIAARFTFQDGLIKTHVDEFAFWGWTRMALGATGVLLGWSPMVHNKVRALAKKNLDAFVAGK